MKRKRTPVCSGGCAKIPEESPTSRTKANPSHTYRQKSLEIFASSTRLAMRRRAFSVQTLFEKSKSRSLRQAMAGCTCEAGRATRPRRASNLQRSRGRGQDESALFADECSLVNANEHAPWCLLLFPCLRHSGPGIRRLRFCGFAHLSSDRNDQVQAG